MLEILRAFGRAFFGIPAGWAAPYDFGDPALEARSLGANIPIRPGDLPPDPDDEAFLRHLGIAAA